jgi:hypothetical protein
MRGRIPTGWDPFTSQWKWGTPSPQIPWRQRKADPQRIPAPGPSRQSASVGGVSGIGAIVEPLASAMTSAET